jgi:hypothetical protein
MQEQLPAPPPRQPSPIADPTAAWFSFSREVSKALELPDTSNASNDFTWRSDLERACYDMSACGMAELAISWFVELVSDDWKSEVLTTFNQTLTELEQRHESVPLDELGDELATCMARVANRQVRC